MEKDKRALCHTRPLTWTVLLKVGDKVSLHGALLAFAFLAFLATLCFEVALVLAALHVCCRGHLAGQDLRTSLLGCTKMEFSCSTPLSRAHEMKLVT